MGKKRLHSTERYACTALPAGCPSAALGKGALVNAELLCRAGCRAGQNGVKLPARGRPRIMAALAGQDIKRPAPDPYGIKSFDKSAFSKVSRDSFRPMPPA